MNTIVWLSGHSGSGKTTLAKKLQENWPCVVLDGDEMRSSVSLGAGFSREDRTEHNLRIARLALVLSSQINVVVSVIAPIVEVREKITEICNPCWVYLYRDLPEKEGHFYEPPLCSDNRYLRLHTDALSVSYCVDTILTFLGVFPKQKYSLFIGRWQPLHEGHLALFDVVRKEGKKILIAIRDTPVDGNNPYSVVERQRMISEKVPDARVIVIPDIEEVVYGRKVGWGIRELTLPPSVEGISATEIRQGKIEKV